MNTQSPFRFMQAVMLIAGVYFLGSGASSVMKSGLTLPGGLLLLISVAWFVLFVVDYRREKKRIDSEEQARQGAAEETHVPSPRQDADTDSKEDN